MTETGFYMITAFVMKGLNKAHKNIKAKFLLIVEIIDRINL